MEFSLGDFAISFSSETGVEAHRGDTAALDAKNAKEEIAGGS
jgi:hypothetical protein